MKRILSFLILLSFFISSCKKNGGKKPPSDGKTYSVNFAVSGFTQEVDPGDGKKTNGLATNAITTPGVQMLYYYIFKSSGSLYKSSYQDSSAAEFGLIKESLPAGTYTIALFAGLKNISTNLPGTQPSTGASAMTIDQIYLTPQYMWGDSFYKKLTFTVTDQNIDQDITLQRVVGKLTLKILDSLPQNVVKIRMVHTGRQDFGLNGTVRDSRTIDKEVVIPVLAMGKPNFTISTIVMPQPTAFNVDVIFYNASSEIVKNIRINNVVLEANKQTILSGKVFDINSSFSIDLDIGWDSPINVGI